MRISDLIQILQYAQADLGDRELLCGPARLGGAEVLAADDLPGLDLARLVLRAAQPRIRWAPPAGDAPTMDPAAEERCEVAP